MESDHLNKPPTHQPGKLELSLDRQDAPDLMLCLARSQKEYRQRLVSARKTMLFPVGALFALLLAAGTLFWLPHTDSWFRGGKKASSIPELAMARSTTAMAGGTAQLASAEMVAASPAIPDPKSIRAPDRVIQLGAFRTEAQAE